MKNNLEEKKIMIETLQSGISEQKIDLINSLDYQSVSDELVAPIANLIADEDKGVRNCAAMFILNSQNPKFPQHIVPFVTTNEISVRNLAGEILIKLGPISVDSLINFNHQNDDDNIKFIVDVLGLIGDKRAALFVLGILSSAENDNVILACIEAMGNLKYEEAMDVLILFYDRNELYKPTIVEALGKIGSKSCVTFLMERYIYEDEVTKYSVLESLGNLGDIETYFYLLELMISVNGPLVLPLITSISKLKEKYNLDIPFDNRMKNMLMYTISEGTIENKKIAFNLIDSFDDRDILCSSLNLLGEDYELDEMIHSKIFRNSDFLYNELPKIIMQNHVNLRHILNLFLLVVNYRNEFQHSTEEFVLKIRNIVQPVSGLLNHPDEEVRKSAMEILFGLDNNSALLFVDTMLADENTWNRIRLVELLENVNDPIADNAIQKLVSDEDDMVRDRAIFVFNSKVNQLSNNVN
jgi:HEAT repeat protein